MLVYLRAHNEEGAISGLVSSLLTHGFEPVVVVSGCTDQTEKVAREAGARTLLAGAGMGVATVTALSERDEVPRLLLDGDLLELQVPALRILYSAAEAGRVGKGQFDRAGRASRHLVEDAALLGVSLPPIAPQSLTTAYQAWPAGTLERIDFSLVPSGYGADLTLSILAHRAGMAFFEVPVGERLHADRGSAHTDSLRAANKETLTRLALLGE